MTKAIRWCGFALAAATHFALSGVGWAQEEPLEEAPADSEIVDDIALLATEEIELLVSRIAFYPDEVIAVTLPAATYPLDIVQAARFLEQQEAKPDAEPNANWDTSVLALLNYPIVIAMMNDDLDWTTSLGETVLNQQAEVIDAIQQVRSSAYTAGYLKSDDKNTVTVEDDVVQIVPADPEVVYVPVYEEAPAPATTTESTSTEITNNVYYPSAPTYSEPYTPYYDESASFWSGALVGGLTVGFLMNWEDDDIDIDFNDGDFDDWSPGRGDINIDGDVNIGNDVDIGNGVNVGKGDSWRQARQQKVGTTSTSQIKTRKANKASGQPAASLQAKSAKAGQRPTTAKVNQKPTKAQAKKPRVAESKKAAQKPSALGNVQRGKDTINASKRGANSQQKALNRPAKNQQATTPKKPRASAATAKPRKTGNSAFGNMNSGKQTKQASNRGGKSQKVRLKR